MYLSEEYFYLLIAGSLIIVVLLLLLSGKVKRFKDSLVLLFSILNDDVEEDIQDIISEIKESEEKLKNGPIAEYNRHKSDISSRYNTEIRRVSAFYDNQKQAMLKSSLAQQGTSRESMSFHSQKRSNESSAITQQKTSEVNALRSQMNNELSVLRNEYSPYLNYFSKVKKFRRDSEFLLKETLRAKKKEYEIPKF